MYELWPGHRNWACDTSANHSPTRIYRCAEQTPQFLPHVSGRKCIHQTDVFLTLSDMLTTTTWKKEPTKVISYRLRQKMIRIKLTSIVGRRQKQRRFVDVRHVDNIDVVKWVLILPFPTTHLFLTDRCQRQDIVL